MSWSPRIIVSGPSSRSNWQARTPTTPVNRFFYFPIQEALFHDHKIEVPVLVCPDSGGRIFRVSAQLYNTIDDYARLAKALQQYINA